MQLFGSLRQYAPKKPLDNDEIKAMVGKYLQQKHKLNKYSTHPDVLYQLAER